MRQLGYQMILVYAFLVSCVTSQNEAIVPSKGQERCTFLVKSIVWDRPIDVLNTISDLFRSDCHRETVAVATKAREKFRYKKYSITKEATEFFLAEGAMTDYVLESYERGYLSFLTAISYVKMNQKVAARIELNKFYNEEVEHLYNQGQDPLNAILQAVLWDNFPSEGFSSRPFWFWLSKGQNAEPFLRVFAQQRVKEIDAGINQSDWQIFEVGEFPEIDWSMKFSSAQSGYFSIRPKTPFPDVCSRASTLLIPTSSWFRKIAIRHSQDYHPLVNLKSWIRLPFGLVYGITTVAAGASLVVGGCALDAAGKGDGALCSISIQGGAAVMAKSDDIVDYTLRPDLRHWEKLPSAILISKRGDSTSHDCYLKAKKIGMKPLL